MTTAEYVSNPKAVYKTELATMLGYSRYTPIQSAIDNTDLGKAMAETGYQKTAKMLTPKQALLIIHYFLTI